MHHMELSKNVICVILLSVYQNYLRYMVLITHGVIIMNCEVCGVESETQYCSDCGKVMNEVIRKVGEARWNAMDDCSFIYPMVKRVGKGELTVRDIIQELERED